MQSRRGCSGAWLMGLAVVADQATKWAVRRWPGRRELIAGVLCCRPVRNSGMAFSLFAGRGWVLTALTAAIVAGLTAWLLMKPDEPRLTRAGFWLIAGGGLGNLIDRLAFGAVTDFLELEFTRFAIFNVADVCVCTGAALAALGMLMAEGMKGRRKDGAV